MSKVINLCKVKDNKQVKSIENKIFDLEMQMDFADSVISFVERNKDRNMSKEYAAEQIELSKMLIEECREELKELRNLITL